MSRTFNPTRSQSLSTVRFSPLSISARYSLTMWVDRLEAVPVSAFRQVDTDPIRMSTLTVYMFGPVEYVSDESKELTVRVHGESSFNVASKRRSLKR